MQSYSVKGLWSKIMSFFCTCLHAVLKMITVKYPLSTCSSCAVAILWKWVHVVALDLLWAHVTSTAPHSAILEIHPRETFEFKSILGFSSCLMYNEILCFHGIISCDRERGYPHFVGTVCIQVSFYTNFCELCLFNFVYPSSCACEAIFHTAKMKARH